MFGTHFNWNEFINDLSLNYLEILGYGKTYKFWPVKTLYSSLILPISTC